jgi:hypothetical protein
VPIGEILPEEARGIGKNNNSACPENNPDYISYHEIAERILHSGNEKLMNIMMAGLVATALQLDVDSTPKSHKIMHLSNSSSIYSSKQKLSLYTSV